MKLTKEQELFRTIVQKAWEDDTFKAELKANPLNAIEKLTGKRLNIPEGKTLVVHDQTDASVVYINIPAELDMDDVELTEEQLEIISGGGDPSAVIQLTDPDPLAGTVGG
jgi:hypothetical protein